MLLQLTENVIQLKQRPELYQDSSNSCDTPTKLSLPSVLET